MKISLPKNLLETILTNCQNFLDKRDRSQITSHIYFEVQENIFILKATDYEIYLESHINIPSIEQGNATANGRQMLDSIKYLKDGEVTIETTNQDSIQISQGKSKTKLPMFNADEFPKFPEYDKNKKLQIESTKFLNSIKNINPAVDTASPKYELNGSLLDIKDYGYNFVATDTRRLAIIEYKSQSVDTLSLIIPKKAINEISKLFIDNFEIYHNSTHLIIKNDEYTFYTKLINGKYPDYEKIIPKDFKYKIALPKDKIIDALQFVKSLANNIKITFKPNEMLFESLNEESGEASTQLEIQTGIEFLCLGINSKYILDFLSQIDGNEFTLCINEPNTPFVVVNGNFSTVIMPVIL
ncbi:MULTISPECIES: DNA polymerase III subunit beta [Helicobacter]|uniref:Beta sliding clamp n=4 Tax=Helicobacter typhlonius TaxID=76936 RepID=A0A099UDC6_9HELI|nr:MULTISPECIES: DNA polymerase III subunit beta [Helicobacter]TLD78946.1 DNA polymerase III subunit beta [Helicobacter typhlonius]TLD90279.1 DNA polymerase III subunit beta [Helicobacter sp. MIT 03-1616]CUU40969.1 DNA polymerase III beta subunit [Helicobacter typhlonius]HCD73438.1 DNA polymerase III subunit beta [Helicobacter sp.]